VVELAQKIKAEGLGTGRGCKLNARVYGSMHLEYGVSRLKGAWWWNDKLKKKVKEKQEAYKAIVGRTLAKEKEVNKGSVCFSGKQEVVNG